MHLPPTTPTIRSCKMPPMPTLRAIGHMVQQNIGAGQLITLIHAEKRSRDALQLDTGGIVSAIRTRLRPVIPYLTQRKEIVIQNFERGLARLLSPSPASPREIEKRRAVEAQFQWLMDPGNCCYPRQIFAMAALDRYCSSPICAMNCSSFWSASSRRIGDSSKSSGRFWRKKPADNTMATLEHWFGIINKRLLVLITLLPLWGNGFI